MEGDIFHLALFLGCIVLGTLWDIGVWYYVGQLPMYDDEDDKKNEPERKRNEQ
jgi:hypothetical protein